jgi:hypothetical protein
MSKYSIVQRGKEGSEEEIKVVTAIPGDKGGGGFRLNFPCLSVHLTSPGDEHPLQYWAVTWSNHHEKGRPQDAQVGANPGRFKIKRIENIPAMLQELDGNRKMVYRRAAFPGGRPMYDFVTMQMQWGTEFDAVGNVVKYGKKHPMERDEQEIADCETIDSIEAALIARFGEETGIQILELFVEHELFLSFLVTEGMKQAA